MRQFKVLWTISLVLGFALLVFSCATGRNRSANAEFRLGAQAVPEGLLLTFSNNPADASHMWISIQSWGDAEEVESARDIISSFAALTNTSKMDWVGSTQQLERVKQTGRVVFPFVQAGQKYQISAVVYNQRQRELSINGGEYFQPVWADAQVRAGHGVYFDRDAVKFELDDAKSAVTLSTEPVFSSNVIFYDQRYSFSVIIMVAETGSVSVGDHHIPDSLSPDGLTWTFEPQMSTFNLIGNEWVEEGVYYSAWAEARVNIIYDDINWSIEVAKTPVFNFSL